MALYTEFAEYNLGMQYVWIIFTGGDSGTAIANAPLNFSFRTPPMRDGDQFDLKAAMEAIPELQIILTGSASSAFTQEAANSLIEIDYEILHLADAVRGVSAYPGKPPRINLGSIAESHKGRVIHYSYLTYNPQYIGRRLLMLGNPAATGGWGAYFVGQDDEVPYRYFFLHRGLREMPTPISRVQIHVPHATWDVNQDTDPPEPPSYEPLDFVIQGNGVISYSYLYSRFDSGVDPPRKFYSTQVIPSWNYVQLEGSKPDILAPLAAIDFSVEL